MTYRVGCSGWSYKHWRELFYPHGLPQARWFQHYAANFDTVEINNSFYRVPTEQVLETWRKRAPEGFLYAMKVNRSITQYHKLDSESQPVFHEFVRRSEKLGPTLGPLLLQLPPSFGRNDERLEAFLSQPDVARHQIAMEFRRADWFADEVYSILRRHRVALVLSDLENLPVPQVETAGWVYARFHGSRGKYFGSYGDEELSNWASRLKDLSSKGYVYYNNDAQAAAVRDARRMRDLLNP